MKVKSDLKKQHFFKLGKENKSRFKKYISLIFSNKNKFPNIPLTFYMQNADPGIFLIFLHMLPCNALI